MLTIITADNETQTLYARALNADAASGDLVLPGVPSDEEIIAAANEQQKENSMKHAQEKQFIRSSTYSCWAAVWPPDSWGRTQDRIIAEAKRHGLSHEHYEFWHKSDGEGRIVYGVNISPEFQAARMREAARAKLIAQFERWYERYEYLVLLQGPEGEVVSWPLPHASHPWAQYPVIGRVADLIPLARIREVAIRD